MGPIRQFVTFFSEEVMYGIDIRLVNDVYPNVSCMPVPLVSEAVRGVVNIRGQVILVLDISVVMGGSPRPLKGKSHVIVLKNLLTLEKIEDRGEGFTTENFEDKSTGFLADIIGDVVSVPREKIEAPARYTGGTDFQFLDGIVKLADQLLIIINPGKVLGYHIE